MSFSSERLTFRLLNKKDRAEFIALYQNPKVMRKIGAVLSKEEANARFDTALMLNTSEKRRQKIWLAENIEDKKFCGIVMLKWQKNVEQVEIGIILSPLQNGKTYADEALSELMHFASSTFCIDNFIAYFQKSHLSVRKLLMRLGFDMRETDESIIEARLQYS